ncbi:MAG: general secretion pathway protein GspL [Pelomonas sp.]|nr:general secretion pathway protein GspL [Roseateles sp.]
MSILILLAPPRKRLLAAGEAAAPAGEYDYLLSPDGRQVAARGRRPVRGLPRATQVVLVLADADVAWRRVELPRAGRQMRAALAGLLEEQLLDDGEHAHFALAPDAAGGQSAWVSVCARPWLAQHLAQLEAERVLVDRVAPLSWPQAAAHGHFDATQLHWSRADGVASLPLEGSLARSLVGDPAGTQWTAAPDCVARAQDWLGAPVTPLGLEQRALAALASPWDLRQFELARRTRGLERLHHLGYTLSQPAWRPLRWGVAALVAVQLAGMNLRAWQERHELGERRAALAATLRETFPKTGGIIDAPAQMQREVETLRASAGREGANDLGPLLGAAAAAWPDGSPPVDNLHFEPGRLTLSSKGLNGAQIEQFRSRLASDGWALDITPGRMTLSRTAP